MHCVRPATLSAKLYAVNRGEYATLENVDLKQRLKKRDYQDRMPRLEIKLAQLQRRAKQLELPVIIVIAGWDAPARRH